MVALPDWAAGRLAAAVLGCAVADARRGSQRAARFLESEDYQFWLAALNAFWETDVDVRPAKKKERRRESAN